MITENEKAVYALLDQMNIPYERVEHPATYTCEEADAFIQHLPGIRSKTLFLTNKKRTEYYLVIMDDEAKYLNTTNYISDPANRNVVEGTQLMNGNQVLGYSRVRKRAAITGHNNDYGRTDRHRIVLNAIFEKCKNMDKTQLASLMFKYLPMITTDIDSQNFQALLDAYLKTGAKEVQQCRIPVDGAFEDNVKVRGMSVLIPDFEANITALHSFIFGDKTGAEASVTPSPSADNSTTTGTN
jgi:anionic cell wall polymer biosynthesis LytR-Cps2A-Psr (LCP) family protein